MEGEDFPGKPPKTYALSGKIMLSSIVILFVVVVFMICLHIYARWYLLRARRGHNLRRRTPRRTQMVFYVEPNNPAAARGLDAATLRSLPVFMYSSKTHPGALECAVCLSAFEEREKIRLLPKCNHSFHIECIDMWFHSHSTCPLCRSPVPENVSDVIISVGESEPGSSSGFCATCQEEGNSSMAPSASLAERRKAAVTIEVPRRNESGDDLRPSSPAIQLKSPASRLQTLKRILSMNIKGAAVSPSSGIGPSCGSAATQPDVERGKDESTQLETRV